MILPFIILLSGQVVAVDFFTYLQRVARRTHILFECVTKSETPAPSGKRERGFV
jgi:hypothetical protein